MAELAVDRITIGGFVCGGWTLFCIAMVIVGYYITRSGD